MKIPAHYIVALVTLLAPLTSQTLAENFSGDELNRRTIERRAVEAVIWGMPAVNFERMLQEGIRNGAAPNQVVYWSRPVNWKDQTLTPNTSTIYFNPFYDTTAGPVVLEIPAAKDNGSITGSVDDAWQCALDDVGPAGVDKGAGGKYLITPPGYKDKHLMVTSCCHRAPIAVSPFCDRTSRAAATPTSPPPSSTENASRCIR
jgi:hypothetical protein